MGLKKLLGLDKLQLKKRYVSKGSAADKEFPASFYIPYECHWNKHTIYTKDGDLMQTIKLDGFSFETADDEDLDIKKNVRNSLLKSLTQGNFALWFHTIRRRVPATSYGKMPNGFARYVDKRWKQKQRQNKAFVNELYISICIKPDTKGAAKVGHFLDKMNQKASKGAADRAMIEKYKELDEAVDRVISTLREYGARRLKVVEQKDGPYCQILEFLGALVNGGVMQPMRLPTSNIASYLPTHRLYFGQNTMEIRGATRTRYAGVISIKEYGPETAAGMMDCYLRLPSELIITQSFQFTNRQTTIEKMKVKQNRLINASDPAISQIAEISDAMDMAISGHIGFGEHHLSITCFEPNIERLEKTCSMAIAEMVNMGIGVVRESINMEPCFWAQLPCNYNYITRKAEINTLNLAGFASLHNYPIGRQFGNHWGNAVTVFDTTSGTPYYFNFHLRDVGHTTIIGPTGAGKTVTMCFLCAQMQKYNCRMFFFDKDRGADIFIRAIGGIYSVIEVGEPTQFNPLQMPDTNENRAFLTEWFKSLVTTNGETVTAHDMQMINEAVEGNYNLKQEDRRLGNLAPFFGLAGPDTLAGRLSMWHSDGPYAAMFDNATDNVDFDRARTFGFEMGDVMQNKATLGPTLLYLFHKINLSLDGTPTMIVLDEAWALIDNDIFSSKIKDWLKTLRKLNAFVVFATQSVEDASKSAINDTLLQQTATQIFLPNGKATEEYKKAFMLSEREYQLIKGTDGGSRFFLLKQGNDVVVAKTDLSGLEEIIPVLSARADTVALCDEIRAELGEDPDDWVPVFMERVQSIF